MLSTLLTTFYDRDLRKFIEEINLFKNEEDLWRTAGSITNPAGNLALHIVGGSSYLFGTILANTGYVRNRDLEFTEKDIPKELLISLLEELSALITKTLVTFTDEDLEKAYPIPFNGGEVTIGFIVVQLLTHVNYHLGQVNYLRRVFE